LFLTGALTVRSENLVRASSAQLDQFARIQTFHVWLPSDRRCRGEKLATFS